jgi:trimeric autotransporter adhesin
MRVLSVMVLVSPARTGVLLFGDYSTTQYFMATANNEFAARAAGGFRFRTNSTLTTGCNLPAGSGVFTCTSDRNLKHAFMPLDGEDVLRRLASMPIETWSYDSEPGVRHAGPVAQDFYAAFGLGADPTSIGHLDEIGIALRAIQALEVRTRELESLRSQLDEVRSDNDRLRQQLEHLARAVEQLKR